MTDKGKAIEEDVANAIASSVSKHDDSMTVRWLAIVEVINDDGGRGLWTLTSEGLTPWDTVGLLGHAMHLQQAATLRSEL